MYINNFWLILIIIILIYQFTSTRSIRKDYSALFQKFKDAEKAKEKKAIELFEEFKSKELNSITRQIEFTSIQKAKTQLEQWKIESELKIRNDAISRSQSVILGKVTEHFVPFLNGFPFNPKEARFIGSPIDMIIFEGLEDESDEISIHFVEVRTGNSSLSKRHKKIREAVIDKNVHWRELHFENK